MEGVVKQYDVAIFEHTDSRRRFYGYVNPYSYNLEWKPCMHKNVSAANSKNAIAKAISEHKKVCVRPAAKEDPT